MNPNDTITQETLAMVRKAQTTGWTTGTGVQGIDLSGVVMLTPRRTPLRDRLARVASTDGALVTQWKALTNVQNQQTSIFPGWDTAGSLVVVNEQDVYSPYAPIAKRGLVTMDAVAIAKGYADALALETMSVLTALMVQEERALGVGAQAYALPAIGTVTVTSAATGGSITSATAVHVKCAARSGLNYFNGGSGAASADATVTVGSSTSTNTATATVPAVKGAVAYDWFVGTSNSNQVFLTTTTVNTLVITADPATAAAALPSLPDLSATAPTTPPTADTSFSTNSFNSILATILGDYGANAIVTPGTGNSSNATWTSLDGAKLTINGSSIPAFDTLNLSIYNAVKVSPTAYMVNAQQASDISELVLGTYLAPTFLQANDATGRANIVSGGYIGTYLNKAVDGAPIRIESHPSVPPGTIIARTDSVPFPGSNVGSVFEVRTLIDYAQYPYGSTPSPQSGPSGPREEFEVRAIETVVDRAPVAQGVISNVANGI